MGESMKPEFEKFATECFGAGAAEITFEISELIPMFTCIVEEMNRKGIEKDTIIRKSLRSICPECGTGLSGEVLLRTAAEMSVAGPANIGGSERIKAGVCDKADCSSKTIRFIWKRAAVPVEPPPSSKCFVATVAFGGEGAPEVATLREFRDRTLVRSLPGRLFVRFYYRLGPSLADGIERWPRVRSGIRLILRTITRFVRASF